jgi:hypothetical protein
MFLPVPPAGRLKPSVRGGILVRYTWWENSGFFKPEYGRKNVKDIPEVGKIFESYKFFLF